MAYRAAVIGCGRIGAGFGWDERPPYTTHCGAYQTCGATELVGVYDKDTEKARVAGERFGVPFYSGTIDRFFLEVEPGIVSVCTPPRSHIGGVAIASMADSVKAIFCEKPIAESSKDARTMIGDCKHYDTLLFVDHQRRFNTYYQEWAKRVRDGVFGEIVGGSAYFTAGLRNTGTHIIDLLRMFLGNATGVDGCPKGDGIIRFGLTDISILQCRFPRLDNYAIFELFLVGSRGTLRINDLGANVRFAEESKRFAGYKEFGRDGWEKPGGKGWEFDLLNGVHHIVGCLDGKLGPISTGEDGLAALKIIEALEVGGTTCL